MQVCMIGFLRVVIAFILIIGSFLAVEAGLISAALCWRFPGSLSGDGHTSDTSSVLNVTGHKDEAICRYLAEKAAAAYGCVVCCSGGFHVDHITEDQISELMSALDEVPLETYQKSQ